MYAYKVIHIIEVVAVAATVGVVGGVVVVHRHLKTGSGAETPKSDRGVDKAVFMFEIERCVCV